MAAFGLLVQEQLFYPTPALGIFHGLVSKFGAAWG